MPKKIGTNPITKQPVMVSTTGELVKGALLGIPRFLGFVGKHALGDLSGAVNHLFYGKSGRGLSDLKTHRLIWRKVKKNAKKEHLVGNGLNSATLKNHITHLYPIISKKIYETGKVLTSKQARQLLHLLDVDGPSKILDHLSYVT